MKNNTQKNIPPEIKFLKWVGENQIKRTTLRVLLFVAKATEPYCPTKLASEIGLKNATITQAVNKLEKLGFAKRIPGKNDGRRFRLHLTPKGRGLLKRIEKFPSLRKHIREDLEFNLHELTALLAFELCSTEVQTLDELGYFQGVSKVTASNTRRSLFQRDLLSIRKPHKLTPAGKKVASLYLN